MNVTKLNNTKYEEVMQKFNELTLKYNNFSQGNDNDDNDIINNSEENINNLVSNIIGEVNKYQNIIDLLKSESENYTKFKNLCEQYIELNDKKIELLNNIKIDIIFTSLCTDITIFNNEEDKKLSSIKTVLFEVKNKISDIDYKISTRLEKINNFKKLINKCTEDKYKDKYLCQICYSGKINTCISPCGHTFCEECSKKMNNCANCRLKIDKKIKMFIDHEANNDNSMNSNEHTQTTLPMTLIENSNNSLITPFTSSLGFISSSGFTSFDPMGSLGFSNI
jgi:hypothetical protein